MDPEFDPASGADFIQANRRAAVTTAVTSLDSDPEAAARSLELSQATGVPAPVINGNLEGFEQQHKAALTAQLLNNNDYLRKYINSDPMAAKVSNDDYAQLDAVSAKVSEMTLLQKTREALDPFQYLRPPSLSNLAFPAGVDPLARFKGGGPIGDTGATLADIKTYPFQTAIAAAVATPLDLFFRGIGGAFETGADEIKNLATAAGGEGLGREVGAMAETEAMGLSGHHAIHLPEGEAPKGDVQTSPLVSGKVADSIQRALFYARNGREPLPTILPEYDDFRAKQNAADVDTLKEATSEAQSSLTRERSPDLFRSFIAQHTDAEIGISGDAVTALYGDKLPSPDDNLLGWVPGIEDKLKLARETGTDVSVPLADWLTHAEPETMQALHDDLRVRPGGITANEVKAASEAKEGLPEGTKPPEPLPEDVPSYRAATALEPLFSVGDRKLALQRIGSDIPTGQQYARQLGTNWNAMDESTRRAFESMASKQGFHDFSINDENGKPVGTINLSSQKSGKQLYIEMINGVNGLGPRDFGPALMRDLLRQLKQEFPEAESITGHRVSGARGKAGSYMAPSASPVVKLDVLDEAGFQKLLEGGQWETYSPSIQAYIKPDAMRSEADRQLVQIVNEEADRIAPKKTAVQVVDTIKAKTGGIEGQRADENIKVGGAYIRYKETYPIILAALDSKDTLGTFRHEVVHHLRQYGFFKPEEWETLQNEALAGGWFSKYRIDARYPTAGPELKLEEAIAEAYPEWKARQEALKQRADQTALPPSPLDAIFQKMKDFFDAIRERVSQIFGKDASWEDVFKRVDTGEVGGREGTEPLDARAFNEKLSAEPSLPKDPLPPPEAGKIRYYHGTSYEDASEFSGKTFVTPHFNYARDYHGGRGTAADGSIIPNHVLYTDLTREEADARGLIDEVNRFPINGSIDDGATRLKNVIAKQSTAQLPAEGPEGGSRVFERASALGMTVDQFKAYDKLIVARHAEDIAAAEKRAIDFQRKTQTKEWKDNRRELRADISREIHQRPDVAADLFFATGELYGQKISSGYKLDSDQLSPEQRQAIPKDYQARGGLNPDDVANIFGYGSGDAMLQRLAEYNAAKKASGLGAKDFVARVTDAEADRQMRLRYGVLEDNIIDSVKEQVASETQLDILHEETHKLGMEIGQAPLDKTAILTGLRDSFNKMQIGSVSSDAYMRAAGKAGRAAELALLKNDPQEAFRAKQQQYYATVIANLAIKTEKALGQFDKLAKRYGRPFDPKKGSVDADYSLMIRSILSQVERPYGMSVQGLEKAFGDSGYASLADFVKKQDDFYSIAGIQLPVADILLDPKFHSKFEDLTVDQFNAVNESIKGLDKFGREIEKVTVAGEKADRRAVISDMTKQLEEKFEPQDFGATGKPGVGRTYLAALTNTETLFARFDGRDPNGLFTKTFTYPAFEAANGKDAMGREFSKEYPKDIKDPKKLVDSPLTDPLTGQKLTQFTRENVATIISNMGNDYNWRVFTKGWGIDPDVLRAWVEKNSTPEDFDRAQALGNLFTKGKGKSDVVYKNIYGIAPENIQVRPFTMHGKQYEGWYHPIIYDPLRSKLSKLQGTDPAEGAHANFWPSVSNAYTKRRTGNVDVISLSQDMVPVKLNQMLHDIAFRDFVHNTAKITRDDAFRRAITKSYGPEYVEVIDKWLERIAGNASYNSTALAMATRISGRLRSNVISTYIAFSATTVEKHGFTAAVMSTKEVGAGKFARITAEVAADSFKRAVSDLFGKSEGLGDTLWQFARKHSEELQRRDRNFEDTLGGAADLAAGRSTLRNRIIQWGSKAVAFSDMLSAVPLWLAKYDEVVNATGDHGMSVQQADRAVRRAHGSTAITNQPLIVSNSGPLAPWLTSIYGFFGTNMQRRIELAHDINDAYKLGRQGEIAAAAKMVPQIMSSIFTYVIWPGLVEEAVTSQFTDDKRGALAHALSFTLGTAASTFIGIRDLVYGLTHGQDAQVGLMSNPLHDAGSLLKDVKKNRPFDKQNAGKLVEDAVTLFGDTTGMGPKHIGAAARYGMDVWNKQQRPKTAGDVYRGVVSGTQSKRTER